MQLKPFTVRLPVDKIRALKMLAVRTDRTVQRCIGDALDAYLRSHREVK